MDSQFNETPENALRDLVEQVRPRLLALKKARVAGSKLASIVGQLLPEGKTFRDLLPGDVDRETASFRVFVQRNLAEVVTITSDRRGTDLLYDIVDSGQEIEPEPGDLWRAFVSLNPKQQLILDLNVFSLSAVAPIGADSAGHVKVPPVSLGEHKDVCIAYYEQLTRRDIQVPQLDEVLQDYTATSYNKWLKLLRTHAPSLDREWGGFRKKAMIEIFKARLSKIGIGGTQFTSILDQFANDAPRTDDTVTQQVEVTSEAVAPKETAEDHVRRRLHSLIDRMTLEQMNALLIPFSLFPTDMV